MVNIFAWKNQTRHVANFVGLRVRGNDRWEHSYLIVRGEILGFIMHDLLRKHVPRMCSLIKNEKLRSSKTIRYRHSLNHKPSQLETGDR